MDQKYTFYLKLINEYFGENKLNFQIIDTGWSNVVIIVDENLVFRFSRFKHLAEQRKIEIKLLNFLSNRLTFQIPKIIHETDHYIIYNKIEGRPFKNALLSSLPTDDQQNVAKEIAHSLFQLHSIEHFPQELRQFPYGGQDFWNDLWNPVAQHLTDGAKKNSKQYFENYFSKIEDNTKTLKLTHCDLGTNNILLKNENSNIAGIIDYGDIALGDIARDFNGFYRNHGLNFTQKIIDSYPGELGLSIWERIKFYAKKQPFMIYYYSQIFHQTQMRTNLIEVINNEFENNSEIY